MRTFHFRRSSLLPLNSSRQMSFQPARGGVFSSADSPADRLVRKTVIASVSLLIRLFLWLTEFAASTERSARMRVTGEQPVNGFTRPLRAIWLHIPQRTWSA